LIGIASLKIQNQRLRVELEKAIGRVFDSGQFVLGDEVAAFEHDFAAYCGVSHGVAVNSGTSALHLALLAAGVRPGDEVITTAFTFVATVAAIEYIQAIPVLVDIDPDTFTIDPCLIESAITARTRAIVPVHLYGHPADMNSIMDIAQRRNLKVVEDAAQAHGARYRSSSVGALGHAACFSFYPSKNLGGCGEGGMVVTDSEYIANSVRRQRSWGTDVDGQLDGNGFNYRMDAIQGAVLRVKLKYLEQWVEKRRAIAARYDNVLRDRAMKVMPWANHAYHIYAIRVSHRDSARDHFRAHDIQTAVHYPSPIHEMPAWRRRGYNVDQFPEAERAARETLSIPVHSELTSEDVNTVARALGELY